MYAQVNNFNEVAVYSEIDDACYNCKNTHICPLITAISNELAILRFESIEILKCEMFTTS